MYKTSIPHNSAMA